MNDKVMVHPEDFTAAEVLKIFAWAYTPTLRQRWQAFWTTYRALRRKCLTEDMSIDRAAGICFSKECRGWYTKMRHIDDMSDNEYAVPMFMRLMFWKQRRHLFLKRKPALVPCEPLNFTEADLDEINGVVRYKGAKNE